MINMDLMKRFNYSEDITIDDLNKLFEFVYNKKSITFNNLINIIHFNFDLSAEKINNLELFYLYLLMAITRIDKEPFEEFDSLQNIQITDYEIMYIRPDLKYELFDYFLKNYYKYIYDTIEKTIFIYMSYISRQRYEEKEFIIDDRHIKTNTEPIIFVNLMLYFNINGCFHYTGVFILDDYEIDENTYNIVNKYR
jgi:hypothetical protein